jgi:hypothetical protein
MYIANLPMYREERFGATHDRILLHMFNKVDNSMEVDHDEQTATFHGSFYKSTLH